jgi:hypothetical protein
VGTPGGLSGLAPSTSTRGRSTANMRSMTAKADPRARFKRAIERRNLWGAEDAARELPKLTLEEALQLVHLYGERGSSKYDKAALRWLERYLFEEQPSLERFARVVASLARSPATGSE